MCLACDGVLHLVSGHCIYIYGLMVYCCGLMVENACKHGMFGCCIFAVLILVCSKYQCAEHNSKVRYVAHNA